MDDLEFAMLNTLVESLPVYQANLALPDPALVEHYKNEQDRVFYVDKTIDDSTLELIKLIINCNKADKGKSVEERKRILVMIDSPGGNVEVLGSVIGAIKNSKTPIHTCCYCTAYSAAADLLACGHKRFALPMTNIMFHAGGGRYEGTQAQIESAKKFFDAMGKRINNEVYSKTKFDTKLTKKLKTEDVYMNEEEALRYGVIDEIVNTFDILF